MSDIKLVYDWLKHSHNNMIVARHSYDDLYPKQTEIACYLSHQCCVIIALNKTMNFQQSRNAVRV